jgi:hypothetical protein
MIAIHPDAVLNVLYREAAAGAGPWSITVEARVWTRAAAVDVTSDAVIEVRRISRYAGRKDQKAEYHIRDMSDARLVRRAIELLDEAVLLPDDAPLPASNDERLAIEAQLSRAWSDLAILKLAVHAAVEVLDNVDLFAPATEKTLRRDIEEAGDKLCRALEQITPDPPPVY